MGTGSNGPLVLAGLIVLGIILPLGTAAWFLFSSSQFAGPNQIMAQTFEMLLRQVVRARSSSVRRVQGPDKIRLIHNAGYVEAAEQAAVYQ